MTTDILAAAAGLLAGTLLGYRVAVASRTYRDARATTRAARALWGQVPRDWARVGNIAGGLLIVAFVVAAYLLGRR
ncbi:hypothetical protein [Dactylosporangium salmoneum]|uniref:Uncharacterized protein n=1 Tax=Dactylosporangium salmoneum TaxID=53361 RepID=A0ABP5SA27_9ACTN